MTRTELQALADVLKGTNILVLSDEIYAEMTYGFNHTSFASLPGMNAFVFLIEKATKPRKFGYIKPVKAVKGGEQK